MRIAVGQKSRRIHLARGVRASFRDRQHDTKRRRREKTRDGAGSTSGKRKKKKWQARTNAI